MFDPTEFLTWARALLHPTPTPIPLASFDAPTVMWLRCW